MLETLSLEGCAVEFDRLKHWLLANRPDLLQAGRLLRYELQNSWADVAGRYSPNGIRTLRRLRSVRGLKLHIASGPFRRDGWLNVDAAPGADVRMDLRRPLPFVDGSVSLIFTEHFFDHLKHPEGAHRFASECHRVLEPGGRLRLVVHDGELLLKKYLERDQAFFDAALGWKASIEAVNHLFRFHGFHNFIYDFETISSVLGSGGFRTVVRSRYRGSEVAELNLDHDGEDRAVQSLYVEASKD